MSWVKSPLLMLADWSFYIFILSGIGTTLNMLPSFLQLEDMAAYA